MSAENGNVAALAKQRGVAVRSFGKIQDLLDDIFAFRDHVHDHDHDNIDIDMDIDTRHRSTGASDDDDDVPMDVLCK